MEALSAGPGLGVLLAQEQLWLLFFLRTAGFVVVAPFLSARFAPPILRIGLAFFLSLIAYLAWSPGMPISPVVDSLSGWAGFLPLALSETVLGLLLGFITGMLFVAFQFAGTLAGYQMGFSVVNILDPQSQHQESIISGFFFVCATLAYLEMNLHHNLIGSWYQSFGLAPPGGVDLSALSLPLLVELMDRMLLLSLKIALPMLAFLILIDLALGILARVVPQLNVFIVGIPLKAAVGMLVLSAVVLAFNPPLREGAMNFAACANGLLQACGPESRQ